MPLDTTTQTHLAGAQAGEQDATESLLRRHAPLVLKIAGQHADPRSPSFDDIKQVGTIGLWNAIMSFDPTRGTAFSTWAYPKILGAVQQEKRRGGVIYVPYSNKGESEETRQLKQIARAGGILLSSPPPSGTPNRNYGDTLQSETPSPDQIMEDSEEQQRSMARYRGHLNRLPPNQRQVVELHLEGMTFPCIAVEIRRSRTWVFDLWTRAMAILKSARVPQSTPLPKIPDRGRVDGRTVREYPRKPPKDKWARYRRRKSLAGLCPRCGKPPERLRLCDRCREKKRESYRRRRDQKPQAA